jgi:hypothetical protein
LRRGFLFFEIDILDKFKNYHIPFTILDILRVILKNNENKKFVIQISFLSLEPIK